MVIIKNIQFATKCAHHGIGIHGYCNFGYIPNDRLFGLSQIPRIIEYYLNPTTEITQETVTKTIADFMEKELKPVGLILVVSATHECMSTRSVRQRNSVTITSEVRGAFKNQQTKSEFLELVKE
jgi:GTP cyclohydrolase I